MHALNCRGHLAEKEEESHLSAVRNTGNKMKLVGKHCKFSQALLWILLPQFVYWILKIS